MFRVLRRFNLFGRFHSGSVGGRRFSRFLEQATDSLRTNQNMYRAWDHSKKFGKLQRLVFVFLAIVPIDKLLYGKGRDYMKQLEKDGCILHLEGSGLEREDVSLYLPDFEKNLIQKGIVATKYDFLKGMRWGIFKDTSGREMYV